MSEWFIHLENDALKERVELLEAEIVKLKALLKDERICQTCGSKPGEYCKGKVGECKI